MIKAIVTDIEGTTSSISFVHDVLFPYARARMRDFVLKHADDPQVASHLDAVRQDCAADMDLEAVIAQLLRWIDGDMKVTPLKALQGLIWEQGYRDGDFHGHVYDDAFENLSKWHAQGIALYVYSSGSEYAQKLLFGHTRFGDLTPLFSGYFDTRIGAKGEVSAYQHIVETLQLPAEQILFLSDVKAELDAARAAGLRTCWLVRDDAPQAAAAHPQVHDFNAIDLKAFG
ncbi:MAG: acireductone synthase [Gammaproteobacteria bacterium]|nr:acireductone synthase [Gammaproteobacteria bacterium]